MLSIKRGTIPTKREFDNCWDQCLPTKFYLEFNNPRVGACSLPRDQIYDELVLAHQDWASHAPDSLNAYNWMCHIMTILEIIWI